MNKNKKKFRIFISLLIVVIISMGFVISKFLSKSDLSDKDILPPELNYFKIRVVDSRTGRGIPLAKLETTNATVYYTDSNGYVAYYEPGLMDGDVFFYVSAHGYRFNESTFGFVGKTITATPGGEFTLQMDRINIAERIYRLTGQGIYSDTVALGIEAPIKNPVINGEVMTSDETHAIEYRGSIYWVFNDTSIPSDKSGSVRVTGATSKLPSNGGLDPKVGVNLEYFTESDGVTAKSIFQKKDGDPEKASLSGLMVVKDKDGNEKLLAYYELSDDKGNVLERGVTVFDDEKKEFSQRVVLESNNGSPVKNIWNSPFGQAVKYTDEGKDYYLLTKFGDYTWPVVRVPATFEAVTDLSQYESFSPYKEGTTKADISRFHSQLSAAKSKNETIKGAAWLSDYLEFDSSSNLKFGWKKNTEPLTVENEKKLIDYGLVDSQDAFFQIKGDNKVLNLQEVTVQYNEHRKAWVLIGLELDGTSMSGEVWFSEAKSPVGPWTNAKKVVTHDNYSLLNLFQYPFFSEDGGKAIYFDGTYTLRGVKKIEVHPTPKYEDNRIMYRLDLTDYRLGLE